jgi:superfamily I DNA/RNA helicase
LLENIVEKLPYDYYIKQNTAGKNGFKNLYLKKNSTVYTIENSSDYYNGELMMFIDYSYHTNFATCRKQNDVEIIIKPNVFGYLPIAPSNVYTIHKSQGLEFENVIVSTDNLFLFPMLYTATTRAKNDIKFYGKDDTVNTGYEEFLLMSEILGKK